ncbi:beta-lactamase/transpeptidase-like protein [Aspergillus falconensis]
MDNLAERLADCFTQIHKSARYANSPSITFGVIHHVVLKQSIGHRNSDVESPAPDADTMYMIGSCSKMFTSAAVGILVNVGKLSWKDPIRKYIPGFNPEGDPPYWPGSRHHRLLTTQHWSE